MLKEIAGSSTLLHRSVLFALVIFLVLLFLEVRLLVFHPDLGLQLKADKSANGLLITKINHADLQGKLQRGDKILAIRSDELPYINLGAYTLVDDPDNYPTLKKYNESYQHNAEVYKRLNSRWISIKMATGEELRFKPVQQRQLSSLPLNFWITNLTALLGLMFAFAIWSYEKQEITTRLLFIGGLLFFLASTVSAIYSSRNLAMQPDWYAYLTAINHLAVPIVAYSLLLLILVYPHRLIPTYAVVLIFLIPLTLWLNTVVQWFDLPFHTFYFGMMLAFASGIPVSIKQWLLSKNKPVEKAALRWMLLSIYIGSSCEVFFYLIPTIFRDKPYLPLWLAQLLFLPIFVGFVMGVFKYRLFDVERWWLISWQWLVNGLLIIGIDWLLVWLLHLDPLGALSIAIILVAWVYFPLRQWLWRHLRKTSNVNSEEYIHDLIEIFAGKNSTNEFKHRWLALFSSIYSTSSAELAGKQIEKPIIRDQGMNLLVPGIDGNYHIDLYGKNQSSKLFNKQDILLVKNLGELAEHYKSLQGEKEKGVNLERKRIMRDLHDDVGANLLSMIYRAKDESEVEFARDTLKMLRETIYTLDDKTSIKPPLAIAKWRQEILKLCKDANVSLRWEVVENLPKLDLSARHVLNLRRILRETLSNALKHARPSYFSVNFSGEQHSLIIQITHDGKIQPLEAWHDGKGIPSIKARIQELHGNIDWVIDNELQTTLTIPLSENESVINKETRL